MHLQPQTDATKWLTTIYLSEVSFLLHTPLFIKLDSKLNIYAEEPPPPVPDWAQNAPTNTFFGIYARNFLGRVNRLQQKIRSAEFRFKRMWHQRHPRPLPLFQIAIFSIRSILNFTALVFIFWNLRIDTGKDTSEMTHEVLHSKQAVIGWRLLLASFVIYILSYFHQRYHLMQLITKASSSDQIIALHFPVRLYWLAHLSIINFSLDFPGVLPAFACLSSILTHVYVAGALVKSVQLSRFMVCTLNIVAGVLLAFCIMAIEPFTKVCILYSAPIILVKNLYFSYRLGDVTHTATITWTITLECAQDSLDLMKPFYSLCVLCCLSICDFRLSHHVRIKVCDQPGVRCGLEETKVKNLLNKEIRIGQYLVSASFAIYLFSIGSKIEYFRLAIDKAVAIKHKELGKFKRD